ncbi:secreted arabinase [Rickenella mellea]|uniref:Arabinan endo-1,5-alpha-L-arabinosidase n=1 Tax=Rickenella mellea TaxID=50990 RepID=A0A4Y7PK31_9AGAM|nr:secreted arabinase [Rickenella mellea]
MYVSAPLKAFAVTLSAVVLTHAVVGPGKVTGDTAVHDPTMCKDNTGKYWAFSTGTGLDIRTSTDRTAWTRVGVVWPNGAPWTDAYTNTTNGVLWAPDCTYANGEFNLYYAASTFGSQKVGVSTVYSVWQKVSVFTGSWTNYGLVTSTAKGNNYNMRANSQFIDNGDLYLSLGSFWTGIKELSSSTGKPTSGTVTSIAQRTANSGAIEASVIYKYGPYYYLFTSWDLCCKGTSSTYNIRVGRSSSVKGPFADKSNVPLMNGGGTLVLGTHDSIIGPGGQDLFTDSDGPILVYHYYTSTGSNLGINRLDFSSGWPVVI